jgi:hypothetical protein
LPLRAIDVHHDFVLPPRVTPADLHLPFGEKLVIDEPARHRLAVSFRQEFLDVLDEHQSALIGRCRARGGADDREELR